MFPKQREITKIETEKQAIEVIMKRRQFANLDAHTFGKLSESQQLEQFITDDLNALFGDETFATYRTRRSAIKNPDAPIPTESIKRLLHHGDTATYVELW